MRDRKRVCGAQFVQKMTERRLTRPLSSQNIPPALNVAYIFMARDVRAKMSDMYFYRIIL